VEPVDNVGAGSADAAAIAVGAAVEPVFTVGAGRAETVTTTDGVTVVPVETVGAGRAETVATVVAATVASPDATTSGPTSRDPRPASEPGQRGTPYRIRLDTVAPAQLSRRHVYGVRSMVKIPVAAHVIRKVPATVEKSAP
jgi:hypothetical protein